jgi:hypothetical protein
VALTHVTASVVLPVCSQLCHLAAATTGQRGERVHYFDTTNSFSAGRLQQLCETREPQVHLHLVTPCSRPPAAGGSRLRNGYALDKHMLCLCLFCTRHMMPVRQNAVSLSLLHTAHDAVQTAAAVLPQPVQQGGVSHCAPAQLQRNAVFATGVESCLGQRQCGSMSQHTCTTLQPGRDCTPGQLDGEPAHQGK